MSGSNSASGCDQLEHTPCSREGHTSGNQRWVMSGTSLGLCGVSCAWDLGAWGPQVRRCVLVVSAGWAGVSGHSSHRLLSRGLVARALSLCVFCVFENVCLWQGLVHALVR